MLDQGRLNSKELLVCLTFYLYIKDHAVVKYFKSHQQNPARDVYLLS